MRRASAVMLSLLVVLGVGACSKKQTHTVLDTGPIMREEFIDDVPIKEYKSTYKPDARIVPDSITRIRELAVEYQDMPHGAQLATFSGTQTTGVNDIFAGYAYMYKPGNGIVARASFGDYLTDSTDTVNRQTTSEMVKQEQDKGLEVLAACNGGFYKLFDEQMMYPGDRIGTPLDMVIKNGWICTSDDGYPAAGFCSDGSAIIGSAYLHTKLRINDDDTQYVVRNINKGQSTTHISLYTEDFSQTTSSVVDSAEIVCRTTGGKLAFNDTLEAVVESVNLNSMNTKIDDGYIVLSAPMGISKELEELKKGDKIHIDCTTNDKRWQNVVQAVGASHVMLWDGNVIKADSSQYGPRTCIGIKEDGTVVVMAIDGRQPGYSVGTTIVGAGEVLKKLGCVYGVNLDGGGSTTLAADTDASGDVRVLNSPSDGQERTNSYGLVIYYKDSEPK